jgi:hypothetical protein
LNVFVVQEMCWTPWKPLGLIDWAPGNEVLAIMYPKGASPPDQLRRVEPRSQPQIEAENTQKRPRGKYQPRLANIDIPMNLRP